MKHQQCLSAEFFYPDCTHCGAPGDMRVLRSTGDADEEWQCIECESMFDAPPSSPWYGVWDLDEEIRRAYIDIYIRKRGYVATSRSTGVSRKDLEYRVKRAHRKLNDAGRKPAATAD